MHLLSSLSFFQYCVFSFEKQTNILYYIFLCSNITAKTLVSNYQHDFYFITLLISISGAV